MSTLRKQLDQLKAQHEAARYPGDLAGEVLPPLQAPMRITPSADASVKPVTANRWFWALGSSSAVAASLIVGFLLTSRPGTVSNPAMTNNAPSNPVITARSEKSGVKPDRNLVSPFEPESGTSPAFSIDLAGSNQNLQPK